MEDSKRPRPQSGQVASQKRHNTRSASISSTTSCCNGITSPIRIRPPTHSLYYLRLHELFFHNENESEDENQNKVIPEICDIPQTIRFGKTRLQSIYKSPNIYVVDQFLSVTDIQYLFTHFISKFKFQRSFVDEASNEECENDAVKEERLAGSIKKPQQPNKSLHRTSAFLALNKQHDSRIASIEQKVATLFGCATKQIEALQLVRYQAPDQHFHVHHDLGIYDEDTGKVELPSRSIWYQRRMITLFCYLNTVPQTYGGATYFPCCIKQIEQQRHVSDEINNADNVTSIIGLENSNMEHRHGLKINQDCETQNQNIFGGTGINIDRSIVCDHDGLRVYPVAGRALIFSNILASGVPDPRTIHAGEPVIVSSHDNLMHKTDLGMKNVSTSKSNAGNRATSKYGLNIWICES